MASIIASTAHGFVADNPIYFSDLVGGENVIQNSLYYVLAAGLTADQFEFSDTIGGTPFVLSSPITSGIVAPWPGYQVVVDGVMDPPDSRSVTHSWNQAPGWPQNFAVAAGFKALGARWDATAVPDLMFYEFRYAPDDGTGTGPNTSLWVKVQTRATTIGIPSLTIGALYWCQVRSVDYTGNVVTSTSDPTPVNFDAFLEAGWTTALSVTPLAVGAADVAFNSVITNILSSNMIDASTIQTGLLAINVSDTTMADGVEVWNAGVRVAKWDETGLYMGSQANGIPSDLSGSDYILLNDAGLTVYQAGVPQAAITAAGVNASAITFGTMAGGHNLVQNSSFELAAFIAAPSTKVWDLAADWTGTQVSNTNATNGANSVTQTASTY
jgi:hypothetical protein